MPCCVLHVSGETFDPSLFLPSSTLQPYRTFRKGEPLGASPRLAARCHSTSGFSCDVSRATDKLELQIHDAIRFLEDHRDDFARLAVDPLVQDQRLDFGYACRLGDDVAVQGEHLPVELLSLVARFRIGIDLSLYPPMDKPSP